MSSALQFGEPLFPGISRAVFSLGSEPFVINRRIQAVWIQLIESKQQQIWSLCCFFSPTFTMQLNPDEILQEQPDLIQRLFHNPTVKLVFPSMQKPLIRCKILDKEIPGLLDCCIALDFPEEDVRAFFFVQKFLFPKGYHIADKNATIDSNGKRIFCFYAIPQLSNRKNEAQLRLSEMEEDLKNLRTRILHWSRLQEVLSLREKSSSEKSVHHKDEQKISDPWPASNAPKSISEEGLDLPSLASDRSMQKNPVPPPSPVLQTRRGRQRLPPLLLDQPGLSQPNGETSPKRL